MKKSLILFSFFIIVRIGFPQIIDMDAMLPKIAAEKNDSIRVRMIWKSLGTSETDPVLDMQNAQKLLVQSQKNKDKIGEVMALVCIGYDYRAFGDNTKSMEYDLHAFAAAEQTPNEESKAGANMVLAFNYEDMKDYPKAVKFALTALDYGSKSKFDQFLTICFAGLGEIYLNMNKIDSALIYSQKGYELSMQIGYSDYLGPLLQQMGSIHERLGNSSLAINYYDLAIKEGYKMNSPKFINTSYTEKAQYYLHADQTDSAIVYSKKAIAIVQNTAFSNYSLGAAKILLDIYRNTDVDSAFKYSEIYRMANDSLFNAKTIQQTQLLAFEENVRQHQLADEKMKADEQRKENIQYALIAMGIIMFIIFFLLLSRSFITNTKLIEFFGVVALLIVFEFLNLLLHPFLEKITNNSPLLMLLFLVCIAALLVPLHHRGEKWTTNKLVEKNKAIRLANAKKTIEQLEENNFENKI